MSGGDVCTKVLLYSMNTYQMVLFSFRTRYKDMLYWKCAYAFYSALALNRIFRNIMLFFVLLIFNYLGYTVTKHCTATGIKFRTLGYCRTFGFTIYEGISKSFRTGHLERHLQMVQLSICKCSCIAILWISPVSFAAITLCVASQQVFIFVSTYFVIDLVWKLLDTPTYFYMIFSNIILPSQIRLHGVVLS